MASVRDILRESLPLLLGLVVLEVIAGSFLGHMEAHLERLPGLLALVPPILAMRGNIYASMASRMGTAMRFGLVPRDRWVSRPTVHNVGASMVLSLVMAAFAALLAHATTLWIGLESAGILALAVIALASAFLSGIVMTVVALVLMRLAFWRGLDMDNIAGPIIMTTGDLFTILSLLAAVALVEVPP